MGTWSAPIDVDRLEELEALVSAPLPASEASDLLYRTMGDDDLFDMILDARAVDSDADVRGLVAVKLDEWFNWTDRDAWSLSLDPAVVDRLSALTDRLGHLADSDVLAAIRIADGEAAARSNLAWSLGLEPDAAAEIDVREGMVPGTWAGKTPGGSIFRYNAYTAAVIEAVGSAAERIESSLYRDGAPRP